MKLAVFDIDGTLTLGDGLGTRCFFTAFDSVFGRGRVDTRLDSYSESTDAAIAAEAVRRALGREAAEDELAAFKAEYLRSLAREIEGRGQAYRPVPGAERVLSLVASRAGWMVAIATGNWRVAASLKLGCAGIVSPAVAACAEDGGTRPEVLAAAVAGASAAAGRSSFDSVVYVGDQPWDLRAARQVGAAFLGIGAEGRPSRLGQEGARVLAGYLDAGHFLAALDQAVEEFQAKGSPLSAPPLSRV